jgi:hypothetical protein
MKNSGTSGRFWMVFRGIVFVVALLFVSGWISLYLYADYNSILVWGIIGIVGSAIIVAVDDILKLNKLWIYIIVYLVCYAVIIETIAYIAVHLFDNLQNM